MMTNLWYDIRHGFRVLFNNPGFAAVAVLALALGVGANSAIFSAINAVLLRPLPFKDPDRLVWVWETQPRLDKAPFTPADFLEYRAQNRSFESVATYFTQSLTLTGAGEPERLRGAIVTTDFFPTLGVGARLGRTFLPEEGEPGAKRVAVISDGFWRRRFGADPGAVGKDLTLNGVAFTVVGVMPPHLRYPSDSTEIWVNPLNVLPEMSVGSTDDVRPNRNSHWLPMVARLKPGVSVEQAQADMGAIARRLGVEHNSDHGVRVVSLHERVVGDVRLTLLVLLGAVGLVLLIACANVANLLLARATSRRKEFAIRAAHGARRARLVRQLLVESVVLALLGCALGLLLAYWGVSLLTPLLPADLPRLKEIGLDPRVLGMTLVVSVLSGLAFGIAPALRASRVNLSETLKEGNRTAAESIRRNLVRSLLVVCEVALSLVVLVGASLLIRSFQRLQSVAPGFNPEGLLTLQVSLPSVRYGTPAQQAAFFQQMTERLAALPGVQSVAVANDFPLEGDMQTSTPNVEGRRAPPNEGLLSGLHSVSHDYFQAMGTTLLKGRAFTPADALGALRVAIINDTMAQRLFPNEDPLGKKIKFSDDPKVPWKEVVGVVADVKHEGLDAAPFMETYLPFPQTPWPIMAVSIRSKSDPLTLAAAARKAVSEVDPDQPVYDVKTMVQRMSELVAPRRLSMVLFTCFAAVALVLASVGVYGVMSYSVSRRTHELGIRLALGATAADVLRLIVGQGLLLTGAGVAVGLAAAFALSRLMSGLLYGVSATDPFTFVCVSLALIFVALLASYIPGRRATAVDPMVALRHE
jgi:putative ABC transport system permease protein